MAKPRISGHLVPWNPPIEPAEGPRHTLRCYQQRTGLRGGDWFWVCSPRCPVAKANREAQAKESPLSCKGCEPYMYGRRKGRGHKRCNENGCECYCNR